MRKIKENYQRITDDKRLFDIRFWQSQGGQAIFRAVTEMLNDYFLTVPQKVQFLRCAVNPSRCEWTIN
jgi:hypothetical protein